jgi:8-oxo-dGTP diphosphatase
MKKGVDYPAIFVSGICHDGNGRVLFRKRGLDTQDEQGKWDPGVGGTLHIGETIEACLRREILEEAGVVPQTVEFLGHVEKFRILDGVSTHWIGFFFKCLIDSGKVVCNPKETSKIQWENFHNYPKPSMTGFEDTYEEFKHHF